MRIAHAAWTVVAAAGLVSLAGCDGQNTGEVSGTVTFDGVPVEDGSITFIPADGKSPTAGNTIKDGKYTVAKVPLGAAKVKITSVKVVGKKKVYDAPNSPEMPITKDPLPAKYNDVDKTELKLDVLSGKNEKNWELTSK